MCVVNVGKSKCKSIMNNAARKSLSEREYSYSEYGYAFMQCVIHISPVGGYNMNKGFDSVQTTGRAVVIQGHVSSKAPGVRVVSSVTNPVTTSQHSNAFGIDETIVRARVPRNLFPLLRSPLAKAAASFLHERQSLN